MATRPPVRHYFFDSSTFLKLFVVEAGATRVRDLAVLKGRMHRCGCRFAISHIRSASRQCARCWNEVAVGDRGSASADSGERFRKSQKSSVLRPTSWLSKRATSSRVCRFGLASPCEGRGCGAHRGCSTRSPAPSGGRGILVRLGGFGDSPPQRARKGCRSSIRRLNGPDRPGSRSFTHQKLTRRREIFLQASSSASPRETIAILRHTAAGGPRQEGGCTLRSAARVMVWREASA